MESGDRVKVIKADKRTKCNVGDVYTVIDDLGKKLKVSDNWFNVKVVPAGCVVRR